MPHAVYVDRNGLEVFSVPGPHSAEPNGHHYEVRFSTRTAHKTVLIDFQEGPVKTFGLNGVTNEALLAILIDRTEVLDSQFPCLENKAALACMKDALQALESRTARRVATGLEGQMKEA